MNKTQTILVPFDFSDASKEALRLAQKIAPSLGAEVVLAHVDMTSAVIYPELTPITVPAFEVTEAVGRALSDVAETSGRLKTILRLGDPAAQILAIVEQTKPMLVCMGTHGRRGLARLVIGSVTEKVVRTCPVPVLTVHAPTPQDPATRG